MKKDLGQTFQKPFGARSNACRSDLGLAQLLNGHSITINYLFIFTCENDRILMSNKCPFYMLTNLQSFQTFV